MTAPRRPKPIKTPPQPKNGKDDLFIMGLDSQPVAKRLMQDNVKGGFKDNQYRRDGK